MPALLILGNRGELASN